MSDQGSSRGDGGHDAKGGVRAPDSALGKAVGYADEELPEKVSGADGLRPRQPDQGTPGTPHR
jgi:hypothetical protein